MSAQVTGVPRLADSKGVVTAPDARQTPIVEITNLSVTYSREGRKSAAVSDLTLAIAAGETVAIVGESGSGKSTTANALLGLLPSGGEVSGGSIRIDGADTTHASEKVLRSIRGRVIGLVPQDPMVALNPTLRIGPQVAEAVRRRGDVPKRSLDSEVVEVLEAAGLDNPVLRARQYPHELSGGMRQRVLIAIALAGRPQLIVADEPTSALDVTVQKRILDHLQSLVRDRGISLLIITHDLGVAADRADRVLVMQGGRVVEQGRPAEILVAPAEDYTRRLIAAAPGLSSDGRVKIRHAGGSAAVADRAGAPAAVAAADAAETATPILSIVGVTKDYRLPRSPEGQRTFRAIDSVSIDVPAGQTVGLVGESGSGKTTTLRVALGLEKPTAGRVLFEGVDITDAGWRELRPLRKRFQLVHQNPFSSLDPKFTVGQSILEPLVSFGVGDRASRSARLRELLDQVALPTAFADRRPAELSGGQRQRVAIARALALKPDLVFLDEPVSALDVSVQEQILTLLATLQDELGLSYLFISHDLAVVAQLAHRVAVLNRGVLVEQGATIDVFANPQSDYTKALLDAIPGRSTAVAPARDGVAAATSRAVSSGTASVAAATSSAASSGVASGTASAPTDSREEVPS
ncbi:dipeptide ABC transporter ATP-binding protein [Subtercola endophyticus]|uniref:dipeptide ABC transporter ATP-binding protein n=1 Tax=Subtercola endophyticus TaxID=2895559 RepID=UPI001E4054B5|nr:ABC transporter ATP-binding protein [Subtercola endophyticus]UFS58278.1 ABC transporter ATP-binding protein [Subtercola endophyticus]